MKIVNAAIQNKHIEIPEQEQPDWNLILKWAKEQNLTGIMYKTVSSLEQCQRPSKELLSIWREIMLMTGIKHIKQLQELKTLLDECITIGIELIPFKGPTMASLYPEPLLRVMGDLDFLIDKKDWNSGIEIVKNRGYSIQEKDSFDTVCVLERNDGNVVELHTCLWEDLYGERSEIFQELGLQNTDHFTHYKKDNLNFRTLGIHQNIIYQIYHMAKHFSISGVGIRHLTDLTLFIKKNRQYIDFQYFWECMEALGYTVFAQQMFLICITYFELDASVLNPKIKDLNIEESILTDIFQGGIFGQESINRIYARNIIRPYLKNNKKIPNHYVRLIFRIIFPFAEELQQEEKQNKFPQLQLPKLWLKRCFMIGKKRFGEQKERYSFATLKEAKERLQLLKRMDLVNKGKRI